MRRLGLYGAAVCTFVLSLLLVFDSTAAMSSAEKDITFWTVAVLPFEGRVGPITGPKAGARLAIGLRDTRHFRVVPPNRLAAALRELGIQPADVSGGISKSDAKKLSDLLGLDGMITGTLSADGKRVRMDTRVIGARGRVFGTYELRVTTAFTRQEAIRSALLLSQRLPYEGLIVRIDGQQALVNIGASQGVKTGGTLYAYEFSRVKMGRDGFTGADRKPIAELEVLRVSRFGAWVRPKKGGMPEQYAKVSTRVIAGEISSGEKSGGGPEVSRPWLVFGGGMGFLTKSYVLQSDAAEFTSDTTYFPAAGFEAQFLPINRAKYQVVVGGSFRHGFIPLRRPIGNDVEEFSGALDQAFGELQFRYFPVNEGRFKDTAIGLGLGYRYSAFTVEDQDPLVLTSDKYGQVAAGLGARIPLFDLLATKRRRFFLYTDFRFIPFSSISQTPLDNGSASTIGAFGSAGLELAWTRQLSINAGYNFDFVSSTFDEDGGTRGLLSPSQTDRYSGFTFRVDYKLIR